MQIALSAEQIFWLDSKLDDTGYLRVVIMEQLPDESIIVRIGGEIERVSTAGNVI